MGRCWGWALDLMSWSASWLCGFHTLEAGSPVTPQNQGPALPCTPVKMQGPLSQVLQQARDMASSSALMTLSGPALLPAATGKGKRKGEGVSPSPMPPQQTRGRAISPTLTPPTPWPAQQQPPKPGSAPPCCPEVQGPLSSVDLRASSSACHRQQGIGGGASLLCPRHCTADK